MSVVRESKCRHKDSECLIYDILQHKLPEEVMHSIVGAATDGERHVISEAFYYDLIGMNSVSGPGTSSVWQSAACVASTGTSTQSRSSCACAWRR